MNSSCRKYDKMILKSFVRLGAVGCSIVALKQFHDNKIIFKQIKSPFLINAEELKEKVKKSQECILGESDDFEV